MSIVSYEPNLAERLHAKCMKIEPETCDISSVTIFYDLLAMILCFINVFIDYLCMACLIFIQFNRSTKSKAGARAFFIEFDQAKQCVTQQSVRKRWHVIA